MIATHATARRTADISESFREPIEAPTGVGEAAVARLELLEPLVEGLVSLGLERRIVWHGDVETEDGNRAFGLIWDFDDVPQTSVPAGGRGFASYAEAGSAKVLWTVAVDPCAEDGCFLATIDLEACGSDDSAREQLLDVWPVVGPLAEQHARRMLATIKSYTEDYADAA